jgi:hypothetical protein
LRFAVIFYGGLVKASATVKTWQKTRLQNLVRHKSDRYYARLFLDGKEIWRSLDTSHFSVAEAELAVARQEHGTRRARMWRIVPTSPRSLPGCRILSQHE